MQRAIRVIKKITNVVLVKMLQAPNVFCRLVPDNTFQVFIFLFYTFLAELRIAGGLL